MHVHKMALLGVFAALVASCTAPHRDALGDATALDRIDPTWPGEWSFVPGPTGDGEGGTVAAGPALLLRSSKSYAPPVRSPYSFALLKGVTVSDAFTFEIDVMQVGVETPHRDAVIVFGHTAADRFFYVHLGKAPDPHCCNVFDVDGAPRKRMADIPEVGVDWGRGAWRTVRVECTAEPRVRVFFGDASEPIFDEPLPRGAAGRVGFGTFDDAALFRNASVRESGS